MWEGQEGPEAAGGRGFLVGRTQGHLAWSRPPVFPVLKDAQANV